MNNFYRITKYDPKNRNSFDGYEKEEWVIVDQIGREINGKVFTVDEYLYYENLYIKVIKFILEERGVYKLKIINLEKRKNYLYRTDLFEFSKKMNYLYDNISNETLYSIEETLILIRLVLRREIKFNIEVLDTLFIWLADDYYMFFEINNEINRSELEYISNLGLFVEKRLGDNFIDLPLASPLAGPRMPTASSSL